MKKLLILMLPILAAYPGVPFARADETEESRAETRAEFEPYNYFGSEGGAMWRGPKSEEAGVFFGFVAGRRLSPFLSLDLELVRVTSVTAGFARLGFHLATLPGFSIGPKLGYGQYTLDLPQEPATFRYFSAGASLQYDFRLTERFDLTADVTPGASYTHTSGLFPSISGGLQVRYRF